MTTDKTERKNTPMARGLLDYFPDALAYVAYVSYVGNEQHNPGEPLHWAKEKSTDHADCIIRHLVERGTRDTEGVLHSGKVAWRALALLQLELEQAGAVNNGAVNEVPPEVKQKSDEAAAEAYAARLEEIEQGLIDQGCPVAAEDIPAGSPIRVAVDPKYVGDWNYPDQLPGFWRVKPNGFVGFYCPSRLWKVADISLGEIVRDINNGDLVPNTWYPPNWGKK